MEQCAIVLNGNDVIKVSNLRRKYDKIMSNPNMKILEECDVDVLEEKYSYWAGIMSPKTELEVEDVMRYKFKNEKTGATLVSIYSDLEKCKMYITDWKDYERIN